MKAWDIECQSCGHVFSELRWWQRLRCCCCLRPRVPAKDEKTMLLMSVEADRKSVGWKGKHAKQCPTCHIPIERIDGCNHMVCGKCRTDFCWGCGKSYAECPRKPCAGFAPRQNVPRNRCAIITALLGVALVCFGVFGLFYCIAAVREAAWSFASWLISVAVGAAIAFGVAVPWNMVATNARGRSWPVLHWLALAGSPPGAAYALWQLKEYFVFKVALVLGVLVWGGIFVFGVIPELAKSAWKQWLTYATSYESQQPFRRRRSNRRRRY